MKLSSTIRLYHDISESKKMLEKDLLTYGYEFLLSLSDYQKEFSLQIEEDYKRLLGNFDVITFKVLNPSTNRYSKKAVDRIYIRDTEFGDSGSQQAKISFFIEDFNLNTKLRLICTIEDDERHWQLKEGYTSRNYSFIKTSESEHDIQAIKLTYNPTEQLFQ